MPPPLSSTALAAASTSSVLMPTTTCPGMGWSTAVANARVTGPPSRAAKWGAVAKLQRHAQGLAVEPDRLVQVVGRQDDHLDFVLGHWFLLRLGVIATVSPLASNRQ